MTERPIIFSGPMVRALLAGRKTQTRRIVKGVDECPHGYDAVTGWADGQEARIKLAGGATLQCPYGARGERLWVRETFLTNLIGAGFGRNGRREYAYRADANPKLRDWKWTPSIHMPRAACRLRLEVTGIRIERLFDISEADCRAEGMLQRPGGTWTSDEGQPTSETARRAFEDLWHSINGAWVDRWVWVVEFRRVDG